MSELRNSINEVRSADLSSLRALQLHAADVEHQLDLGKSEIKMLQTTVESLQARFQEQAHTPSRKEFNLETIKELRDAETCTDASTAADEIDGAADVETKHSEAHATIQQLRAELSRLREEQQEQAMHRTEMQRHIALLSADKEHMTRSVSCQPPISAVCLIWCVSDPIGFVAI